MTQRLFIDWKFVSLFAGICLAWLPLYVFDISPRMVGWVLASVAAFGLCLRLVLEFNTTPAGMRVAASLLLMLTMIRAWAQRNAGPEVPITWATYAYVSVTIMCIVYAWYWPHWTETKVTPFVTAKG